MPSNPAKSALRAQIKAALRAATPDQRREWSAAIVARIAAMPRFAGAHTILFYSPMLEAGEVDITPLAALALASSKTVVFPRVQWSDPGASMTCGRVTNLDHDLDTARPRNPLPSLSDIPISQLDLILVPGLAFDHSGNRLGRGGGHYDRLLAHPDCRAVSLAPAFDLQLVQGIPTESHDRRVDFIVTQTSVFKGLRSS